MTKIICAWLGGVSISGAFSYFGGIDATQFEFWTITAPLCFIWGMLCAKFF